MLNCRICGNHAENRLFTVKEMMFGTRKSFEYFQCAACECLQIRDIPLDMSPYYPGEYYSFNDAALPKKKDTLISRFLRKQRASFFLDGRGLLGRCVAAVKPVPHPLFEYLSWLKECKATLGSALLDVGSGMGKFLLELSWQGFSDLTGVDKYIPLGVTYPFGVRVLKKELAEIEKSFDVIILNHAFEHMPEPLTVLAQIKRLLAKKGTAVVRIPTVSSYSFKHFGEHWVQLDAPRHLFLHSLKSFKILAEKAGLTIKKVEFDSTEFQFWGSEQYQKDIPLFDERSYFIKRDSSIFSEAEMRSFAEKAKELNAKEMGDQVCVYLTK